MNNGAKKSMRYNSIFNLLLLAGQAKLTLGSKITISMPLLFELIKYIESNLVI